MPLVLDGGWHTSSKSAGGNCLQARWRKSSYSGGNGCIDVRQLDVVQVRDSKDKRVNAPILEIAPGAWAELIHRIQLGELAQP